MIKALAILILCLFFSFNLSASYHCCDSPDADFINLGQKYPSVGYFSCKTGIFGSGTLVDLGPEELKGRVVITCAHIFNDEDIKDISFTVGDTPPIRGKAFQHSKYRELIKESETAEKLISPDSFDLCLFILDIPILNIPLASADLNTPTKSLVGSAYVSVGFGRTGHFFGKCLISDSNKRASYAFALHEENEQKDQEHLLTIILEDEHGTSSSREQNVIELCGSTLALTPYVKGKEVSKLTHDHQTFENLTEACI